MFSQSRKKDTFFVISIYIIEKKQIYNVNFYSYISIWFYLHTPDKVTTNPVVYPLRVLFIH